MKNVRDKLRVAAKRIAWRLFGTPQLGKADMGDLARTEPISPHFGYDRGTPIDRFYIERFLASRRRDIRGRVLEVGETSYSRRFGSQISRQDVLHLSACPEATIVGDISVPGTLPAEAFDCIILTQTLHLIYDMPAALAELYRALRSGGVALVTVPGVSSVDRGQWGSSWQWSLTGRSARRLFGETFGSDNVEIDVHGNVYAATCFLHGLAVEEVEQDWLEHGDPAYPVTVAIRAVRAG